MTDVSCAGFFVPHEGKLHSTFGRIVLPLLAGLYRAEVDRYNYRVRSRIFGWKLLMVEEQGFLNHTLWESCKNCCDGCSWKYRQKG
jgi:hypothetical protein